MLVFSAVKMSSNFLSSYNDVCSNDSNDTGGDPTTFWSFLDSDVTFIDHNMLADL